MELPLVSVIVPIYKVELYLCQCVDSIINQTYNNLEIILVDDGSPDNCPSICNEYAQKDNRIKVIHKKNGGLSDARNAGMKNATGDYWSFVDSDDVCHERMIEILMKPVIDDKTLKMSVCQYKSFENDKELIYTNSTTNNYEIINYNNFFSICSCVSWAKVYSKKIFEHLEFPVGKLHEDEFTTYKLVANAQKIAYSKSQLYFYRQRNGSIMSTRSFKSFVDIHDALKEQLNFFSLRNDRQLCAYVLVRLARQYALYTKNENSNNKIQISWKKELKTYSLKNMSFKQKISYITYIWLPKLRLFFQNN